MDIIDFLPTYTEFDKDVQAILGPDLVDTTSLYLKKEFHDYKLEAVEKRPEQPGQYMNHQVIMARFLSSHTPYKGILVMHEPGTGKTCLSVAVIEKIRSEKSSFRGALLLMKGKTLIENYKKELVEKCTDGRYKIKDEDEEEEKMVGYEDTGNLTANKVKRRINKKLAEFYQFQTFETFSKQLSKMSDKDIIKYYSNIIIVIDEAHHLRVVNDKGIVDQELKGQYNNIFRLLHLVENSKTILMTGTPMIDTPSEIASLMNLLLDNDHQLSTGKAFEEEYMITNPKGNLVINPKKEDALKGKLYGKVSFLRSMQSSVKREFVGTKLDLQYFKQFGLPLKPFQEAHYKSALQEDRDGKGIYINSREASLFVFPDGTYGSEGFKNYTSSIKERITNKIKIKIRKTLTEPFKNKTILEKLEILSTYSIKYANCIRLLLENKGNHFVYMDFVQGSGAIIFAELLKEFGFCNFREGGEKNKYALLTSKTSSDINDAIRIFNSDTNVNGDKIKVIIGTKIISEGFTLKNVRHVHILTPHWNFSETDQAIARAFRLFSHSALEKLMPDIIVKIYLYTILISEDKDKDESESESEDESEDESDSKIISIDRYMYKFCEDKDISIKSIEHILKQVSFDCQLVKERNRLPSSLDNSRNCEYQKCSYKCYDEGGGEDESEEDEKVNESTYHLFYNKDEMDVLVERIKKSFNKKSCFTLLEMKKEHPTVNYHLLLQTILYMIENKIVINNKNGMNLFLYYSNDLLYVSLHLYDSNVFDVFYTKHIPLQLEFNFNAEINALYNKYLPILFERLKTDPTKFILDKFGKDAKELILEIAILSREKGYKNNNLIRTFIIDQFSAYVFKSDTTIVSSLLGKKNYRCLVKDDDEWKKCPLYIKPPVIKQELNEYGYVGLYDDKGVFKIKDQQKDVPKDTREVTTGVKCVQSVPKTKLLTIIHQLKINPETVYTVLDKKTDVSLKDLLRGKKDIEMSIDDLSRADLIRLLYWVDERKKIICDAIEQFFKEKRIIIK